MEYEDKDEGTSKDEDFLEDIREKFMLAVQREEENRELARQDIDFGVFGEQWDSQVQKTRSDEGRPCHVINKFPAHIRQVVNDARQNKPSIRVRPVDDNADIKTAEVINGLIRNIEVVSKADIAYDTAIQQSATGGFGYIRVNVDYAYDDTFDKEISIERILNQFSVYGDPYSTSADGSDWNCAWVCDRIPKDEFEEKYPDFTPTDWEGDYKDQDFEYLNDDGVWIAEYWHREEIVKKICLLSNGATLDEDVYDEQIEVFQALGVTKTESRETKSYKVTQYIISGKDILEENPWAGKYIPIIPVYGEEVVSGEKRQFKSLIRDAKDAQILYNFWRSAETEAMSNQSKAPVVAEEGSLVEVEKWNTSNVKNYPYLLYRKGAMPPVRQPFPSIPAGMVQQSQSADMDIKATMGMFGASIGEQDNAVSGRAILARQRESDTGTFHFIDNLSRSLRHIGCIIVDLIPHVYTPGRVIRVLGEDLRETVNVKTAAEGQTPDVGQGIYDLTTGKYDVVVDTGPGFTTKRQESAMQMIELMRVNPAAASIMGDLLAKNLDWPGAQEIAERFKAMLPPQLQGQNPQLMQMQQQLQQAQQMLQQMQQQLESGKIDKSVDIKKVEIDAYKAETDRMQVMAPAMGPQEIQALVIQTLQQVLQTGDITPFAKQQAATTTAGDEPASYGQQQAMGQPPMAQQQGVLPNG